MKNKIFKSALAFSAILLLVGCEIPTIVDNNSTQAFVDNNQSKPMHKRGLPSDVQTAIDAPDSTLSPELMDTLSYMGNEERLAYDVYNKLYEEWENEQFTNIANNSEKKHIQAVQKLVRKYHLSDENNFSNIDLESLGYQNTDIADMKAGEYDISKIQALYDELIAQGMTSEEDALKVGCSVEVIDIEDLDKYIALAEESNASDLVTVFEFLREGSYHHYWAFDQGLKNKEVEKGCCTWEALCHEEYPKNEHKGHKDQEEDDEDMKHTKEDHDEMDHDEDHKHGEDMKHKKGKKHGQKHGK